MAISITGSFKVGYATYIDPQIQLVPHLTYRGMVAMDAVVAVITNAESGSTSPVTTIPYYPKTSELSYPTQKVDPYSDLITALDQYVITQLTGSNPDCTFNTF